jgi:hypothetical protein
MSDVLSTRRPGGPGPDLVRGRHDRCQHPRCVQSSQDTGPMRRIAGEQREGGDQAGVGRPVVVAEREAGMLLVDIARA